MDNDYKYMKLAMQIAKKSLKSNDVPVGAIIIKDDIIIGRGYNRIEKHKNATCHAEIQAINSALRKIGYKHLLDCTIYVTLEPCSMCAGAIVLARIKRVVIAANEPKFGAGGSIFNVLNNEQLNHRCEVTLGIMKDESSEMLKSFFKKLRENK